MLVMVPPPICEEPYFFRNSIKFNHTTQEVQYYLIWIRSNTSHDKKKTNTEI